MSERQTVVITGGAQRVGLHCAQRLVEDGYDVIITCRQLRPEWETSPLKGIDVVLADFSTVEGIQAFIDELNRRNLRLRALIHNASAWIGDEQGDAAMQQMFMVHMQAPYMINSACCDWFDAAPETQSAADIIHITDYVVQRGSAKHVAYCATKAGLQNLALSFASRYAPRIKVNAIAPAMIMFNDDDPPEYRTKTLAKSALGIEPGPDVVYQAIRYLMDNPYVTGSTLELNGGRNLRGG